MSEQARREARELEARLRGQAAEVEFQEAGREVYAHMAEAHPGLGFVLLMRSDETGKIAWASNASSPEALAHLLGTGVQQVMEQKMIADADAETREAFGLTDLPEC